MTSNVIQFLLIGVLFIIIGLCILVLKKKRKLIGLLPLIIGVSAILLATVSPLAKSQAQLNQVLQLDRKEVTKFIIKPTEQRMYKGISLVQNIIEVTNNSTIDSLCLFLQEAEVTNSIIKNPKWICLVRVEKVDKTFFEFQVKNAGLATYITVKSNGDYGWIYGTINAKAFGQLLFRLVQ